MKKESSALDIHYLVEEFQELIGAKIDKIFQPSKTEVVFQIHVPGVGKKLLRVMLPSIWYLASKKPKNPQNPLGYCTFLRKYLTNARIVKIEQCLFERIITIELSKKDTSYLLIFELFSKGNIIVCENTPELTIMQPLSMQKWKDRIIRKGEKYVYPQKEFHPKSLTKSKFAELLSNSSLESIVVFIATVCGFGGMLAEEICGRAKIDKKTPPQELNEKQIEKIVKQCKNIFNEKAPEGTNEKNKEDVSPIHLTTRTYTKRFDSLNAAFDDLFSRDIDEEKKEQAVGKENTKLGKVEVILKQQNKQLNQVEKSIVENTEKGDLVYAYYPELAELIANIEKAKKTMSLAEIKKKMKHPLVKEFDIKNKKLILELKEK